MSVGVSRETDVVNGDDVITHSVATSVYINNLPVATIGAQTVEGEVIIEGSQSVFAEGKPVSYIGSAATDGFITTGSTDVLTG